MTDKGKWMSMENTKKTFFPITHQEKATKKPYRLKKKKYSPKWASEWFAWIDRQIFNSSENCRDCSSTAKRRAFYQTQVRQVLVNLNLKKSGCEKKETQKILSDARRTEKKKRNCLMKKYANENFVWVYANRTNFVCLDQKSFLFQKRFSLVWKENSD